MAMKSKPPNCKFVHVHICISVKKKTQKDPQLLTVTISKEDGGSGESRDEGKFKVFQVL